MLPSSKSQSTPRICLCMFPKIRGWSMSIFICSTLEAEMLDTWSRGAECKLCSRCWQSVNNKCWWKWKCGTVVFIYYICVAVWDSSFMNLCCDLWLWSCESVISECVCHCSVISCGCGTCVKLLSSYVSWYFGTYISLWNAAKKTVCND
jgi:hypothetical protein